MKLAKTIFCAVVISALAAAAQQEPARPQAGNIVNGHIEIRSAAAGLEPAIRNAGASGANWVAYSVPVIDGEHTMCCFDSMDSARGGMRGRCRLDGDKNNSFSGVMRDGEVFSRDTFLVVARLENGEITRIRPYSCDCTVDAGGAKVVMLTGVDPAQSVQLLMRTAQARVTSETKDKVARQAVDAIAMHRSPAADAALDQLASPGRPNWMRKHAAFWLGNSRGQAGYATIKRLLASETDADMRKHFVFPLSQSSVPAAQGELIQLARNDQSPRVRGEAIFWLAQQAGRKAVGTISDAIENDPDTEVKKKAVFALSQIGDGEGVPKLIEVARTHRNPAVRKQAFFWLGESRDDRALAFIEEILRK